MILSIIMMCEEIHSNPSYTGDYFSVTSTYYYAYPNTQTASGKLVDPEKIKIGEHRWIAVSRDIKGNFTFGDTVQIYSENVPELNGKWVVHDLMGPKARKRIDFLVRPGSQLWNPHRVIMKKNKRNPGI